MSTNPELGQRIRTGAFHSNVHDVGQGFPVLAQLRYQTSIQPGFQESIAQLVENFLAEADALKT